MTKYLIFTVASDRHTSLWYFNEPCYFSTNILAFLQTQNPNHLSLECNQRITHCIKKSNQTMVYFIWRESWLHPYPVYNTLKLFYCSLIPTSQVTKEDKHLWYLLFVFPQTQYGFLFTYRNPWWSCLCNSIRWKKMCIKGCSRRADEGIRGGRKKGGSQAHLPAFLPAFFLHSSLFSP